MATEFTPFTALLGGLFIGLAAAMLLLCNGRIAGISGIFHGLLRAERQPWQIAFLLGLVIGSTSLYYWLGDETLHRSDFPLTALITAGFLAGIGTRLGNGCTSGHGVCGIGRRSVRSLAATVIFLLTAMLATTISRHWLGLY